MYYTVFISFGGPDVEFANKLHATLESLGVNAFFFPVDSVSGKKIHRTMSEGVNRYDKMVLVCSESSLNRPGVLNEIEEVLEREAREGGGEVLIPITLDDCVYTDWTPEHQDIAQAVRDRVIADFRKSMVDGRAFESAIYVLLRALRRATTEFRGDACAEVTQTLEFVRAPPGEFRMGSEEKEAGRDPDEVLHRQSIHAEFDMSATVITQAHWEAVMGTRPWQGQSYVCEGAHRPAVYISWHDASEFCSLLTDSCGRTYRLPTEAEWEYACRAATTSAFSFGDDVAQLARYGWFYENAWISVPHDARSPLAVAQREANPWGLFDMHGNVWEWCRDRYGPYGTDERDLFSADYAGSHRVIRGGACNHEAIRCRSACRGRHAPGYRAFNIGFRLVRERRK